MAETYVSSLPPVQQAFLQRSILAGDFIAGVSLGIMVCMYASCLHLLWNKRRTRRYSAAMIIYLTTLIATLLLFSITTASRIQTAYVDYQNSPGGPLEYYTDGRPPIYLVQIGSFYFLTFLADSLVVPRVTNILLSQLVDEF